MEEGIQTVLLLSNGYHLPWAHLMWRQYWTKWHFLCENKMATVPLQGLRKARELDRKAASCSFLQQRKENKKKHIVSPPSWPLTARHRFSLRLSRNLTLGLRSRKENSKLFLRVNANKILSKVFSSRDTESPSPCGAVAGLCAGTQGLGSLPGPARKPVMPLLLPRQLCHPLHPHQDLPFQSLLHFPSDLKLHNFREKTDSLFSG